MTDDIRVAWRERDNQYELACFCVTSVCETGILMDVDWHPPRLGSLYSSRFIMMIHTANQEEGEIRRSVIVHRHVHDLDNLDIWLRDDSPYRGS